MNGIFVGMEHYTEHWTLKILWFLRTVFGECEFFAFFSNVGALGSLELYYLGKENMFYHWKIEICKNKQWSYLLCFGEHHAMKRRHSKTKILLLLQNWQILIAYKLF